MFGNENDQQSDILLAQLSQEMYNSGLLLILLRNLHKVDFEGKKDAAQIFNNILRRQIGTRTPTVEYICTTPEILFTLCKGEIIVCCRIGTKALSYILIYSFLYYTSQIPCSKYSANVMANLHFSKRLLSYQYFKASFVQTSVVLTVL